MSHKQVRSPILGDFMSKVLTVCQEEGYQFNEHEVYRLGREYIADLRKPSEEDVTATFQMEPVVEESEPEELSESPSESPSESSPELPSEEVTDTTIPDWELCEAFVEAGDKEGLEAYARKFDVELSRRKTVSNMYSDFKTALGA